MSADLHCHFVLDGRQRYRLPDLAVVLGQSEVIEGHLFRAPDIVVEIRSPDQTVAEQLLKCREYLDAGSRFAVVIVPEQRLVHALEKGREQRTYHEGDLVTLGDLLPGFELSVSELFD
ncbi:MAG: Uma2 family endonuclease [Bryobacteraceae bacterium]|nr:Uma2 family endonuclease [Bryobacteraceae bacterium]